MCATSWCHLHLTFDLAYLMLFIYLWGYVTLFYLSYISLISFYLNLGCCNLGVARLSTVKVILEFINRFTFATSHCNGWYCIK